MIAAQREGGAVLDTRMPDAFTVGHLPGSVNVGLGGRFAEYARDVLSPDDRIVLVCDPGSELEAKVRLGQIGFDGVIGHLEDPVKAFLQRPDALAQASRLTSDELAARRTEVDPVILDVRNPGEVEGGSIPGAVAIPLARLVADVDRLDATRPTVVYCAGGYRSSVAASVLRSRGFADVSDLLGGYPAWAARRHGPPTRAYAFSCESST